MSILWPGTVGEHWVLILDKNRSFHAKQLSWNKETPLEPSEYTKVYKNPINLECEASFTTMLRWERSSKS